LLVSVPATQLVPSQQPVEHGSEPEQPALHLWVTGLQAFIDGQSLGPLQPHAPAMQVRPSALAEQLTHEGPQH
jgi:hypothetical protein